MITAPPPTRWVAAASAAWLLACSEAPPFQPGVATGVRPAGDVARLVLIGDAGEGSAHQLRVARAARSVCAGQACDAVLLAGDLLYPRGFSLDDDADRAHARIVAPYAGIAPIYAALGNHDYGHGRDRDAARRLITWAAAQPNLHVPSTDYRVRIHGFGGLWVIDTNAVFQWGDAGRAAWLADELDREPGWRLVLGHHPLLSNGPHGNAGAYEGWSGVPYLSGRAVADTLRQGLCDRADVYVSGHDHSLQLLESCAVTLVVSGAGAKVTPLVDRGNSPLFASSQLGFAILSLGESTGDLTWFDADANALATFPLEKGLRSAP